MHLVVSRISMKMIAKKKIQVGESIALPYLPSLNTSPVVIQTHLRHRLVTSLYIRTLIFRRAQ